MNSTMAAKVMFGGACIEGVGTEVVSSLEEGKLRGGNDEMNEAFFGADRAITFSCCVVFDSDAIANFTAVTAAIISC
jgi:hypothetical protein